MCPRYTHFCLLIISPDTYGRSRCNRPLSVFEACVAIYMYDAGEFPSTNALVLQMLTSPVTSKHALMGPYQLPMREKSGEVTS